MTKTRIVEYLEIDDAFTTDDWESDENRSSANIEVNAGVEIVNAKNPDINVVFSIKEWKAVVEYVNSRLNINVDCKNLESENKKLREALSLIEPSGDWVGWQNSEGNEIGEQLNKLTAVEKE